MGALALPVLAEQNVRSSSPSGPLTYAPFYLVNVDFVLSLVESWACLHAGAAGGALLLSGAESNRMALPDALVLHIFRVVLYRDMDPDDFSSEDNPEQHVMITRLLIIKAMLLLGACVKGTAQALAREGVNLANVADAVTAQIAAGLLTFVRFNYPSHIIGGKLFAECGDRPQAAVFALLAFTAAVCPDGVNSRGLAGMALVHAIAQAREPTPSSPTNPTYPCLHAPLPHSSCPTALCYPTERICDV